MTCAVGGSTLEQGYSSVLGLRRSTCGQGRTSQCCSRYAHWCSRDWRWRSRLNRRFAISPRQWVRVTAILSVSVFKSILGIMKYHSVSKHKLNPNCLLVSERLSHKLQTTSKQHCSVAINRLTRFGMNRS